MFKICRIVTQKKTDKKIAPSYTSAKTKQLTLHCIVLYYIILYCIVLLNSLSVLGVSRIFRYQLELLPDKLCIHKKADTDRRVNRFKCSHYGIYIYISCSLSKHFPNRKCRFIKDNTRMTFCVAWLSWSYPQSSIFLLRVLCDRVLHVFLENLACFSIFQATDKLSLVSVSDFDVLVNGSVNSDECSFNTHR